MADELESLEPSTCDAATRRLEEFFDQFPDELLGTLYYVVGNLEDARDALQDTFLKCWKHRHDLDEIQNLKAWVFRIALNTGRDFRKTAWNRRRTPLQDDASMENLPMRYNARTDDGEGPAGPLLEREELQQLRTAVADLPAEQQEVFLLRQNGELSYPQIAEAMSIPLGTVKTRMRSAIRTLRETVGDLS
ncbi:MAG: sigma-70 family RNA polymerase sigma factor [Planctomycetota bacterium]